MSKDLSDPQVQAEMRANRQDGIEHNAFVKNIGNTKSMRLAVNAMCAHCMGCNAEHMESGYKKDVRDCKSTDCPLWHFRPYRER